MLASGCMLTTTMLLLWLMLPLFPTTIGQIAKGGMLFPRESESRDVRSLDGVWNFRRSPTADPLMGFRENWYLRELKDTIPMPVPASYNDITVDKELRDHVGVVWYDRSFFVPDAWRTQGLRVWVRFGSVNYAAEVWINGNLVVSHEIGHLPFQAEITSVLKYGTKNLITVAVDNTLLDKTIPQGQLKELQTKGLAMNFPVAHIEYDLYICSDTGPKVVQTYTFDFFNYAGIHRPVYLYTTPPIFIDDINVHTDIVGDMGIIEYNVSIAGFLDGDELPLCQVDLLDREGNFVIRDIETGLFQGTLEIPVARLWWPYLMDPDPGYLYTLQVRLSSTQWSKEDIYRLPVGIRKIQWSNKTVLINGREIYIRGFGRHEDSDIRGKGLDYALVVKDHNLIKWIGANTYRTSHYPYAEEIMDFADQQGIMIIDECPSVNTENYSEGLLKKHMDSLSELIRRDKNRPSVVMWSIANEARTQLAQAGPYFKAVADHVRKIDLSRPITSALAQSVNDDKVGQHLDVIGFNRYNGWYTNPGKTDTIRIRVEEEALNWFKKYNKPIIMMEYGADTMEGLHLLPEFVWSEEYQVELLSEHFKAFDNLRTKGFFIGEMIWNFADFKTDQAYTRVGGNKKGLFTRARQPKASAFHIRKRYLALAEELDNAHIDLKLESYIASPAHKKTEL